MALTEKQKAFIEEFLVDRNATQAAIRAGYSEKTARQTGSENLSKPYIAKVIQDRLDELKMSADEAMNLLSNQARASMADFIRVNRDGTFDIDFSTISNQQLRNIKSVSISEGKYGTNYRFELYDAQSAIKEIIRLHRLDDGKSTDSIEHKHMIDYSQMSDDELRKITSGK